MIWILFSLSIGSPDVGNAVFNTETKNQEYSRKHQSALAKIGETQKVMRDHIFSLRSPPSLPRILPNDTQNGQHIIEILQMMPICRIFQQHYLRFFYSALLANIARHLDEGGIQFQLISSPRDRTMTTKTTVATEKYIDITKKTLDQAKDQSLDLYTDMNNGYICVCMLTPMTITDMMHTLCTDFELYARIKACLNRVLHTGCNALYSVILTAISDTKLNKPTPSVLIIECQEETDAPSAVSKNAATLIKTQTIQEILAKFVPALRQASKQLKEMNPLPILLKDTLLPRSSIKPLQSHPYLNQQHLKDWLTVLYFAIKENTSTDLCKYSYTVNSIGASSGKTFEEYTIARYLSVREDTAVRAKHKAAIFRSTSLSTYHRIIAMPKMTIENLICNILFGDATLSEELFHTIGRFHGVPLRRQQPAFNISIYHSRAQQLPLLIELTLQDIQASRR